jgi:hypothetical protein
MYYVLTIKPDRSDYTALHMILSMILIFYFFPNLSEIMPNIPHHSIAVVISVTTRSAANDLCFSSL